MENYIDTIVYIVIAIIISIISAVINSSKKKAQKTATIKSQTQNTAHANHVEEKIFTNNNETINHGYNEVILKNEDEFLHKNYYEEQIVDENIVDEIHIEEGSDILEKIKKDDIEKPVEIQEKTEYFDFDLRKAVIYSEILNRKY